MLYKVNKQKCTGCRACIANCPGATKMGTDGKAEVIDQRKLEQCGGEKVCPFGAIERVGEDKENESNASFQQPTSSYKSPFGGRGMGRGPRDGRGRGRGGGGRRWQE